MENTPCLKNSRRKADALRIFLLPIGCFFLFDPFFESFDILPDLIGAVILLCGAYRLSFFDRKAKIFTERMKGFIVLSAFRLLVACCVGISDFCPSLLSPALREAFSGIFDATMRLTYSLVFAVLDCILLIPAFSALFEGLEYVYMRNAPKEDTSETTMEQRKSIHILTVIFILTRALADFVPMLTVLFTGESSGAGEVLSYETINLLLTGLCWILVFVLGLSWLLQIRRYFSVFSRDGAFQGVMQKRWDTEIIPDDYLWNTVHARRFSVKTTLSMLFLLGVPISSYYIFPAFLWGFLSLSALFDFPAHIKRKKATGICLSYMAVGLACYAAMIVYANRFGLYYSPMRQEGFWHYFIPPAFLQCLLSSLFIVICSMERNAFVAFSAGAVGLRSGAQTEHRRLMDGRIKHELRKKANRLLTLQIVFAVIYAGAYIAMPWIETSWIAAFALCLFLLFYTSHVTDSLISETEMAI